MEARIARLEKQLRWMQLALTAAVTAVLALAAGAWVRPARQPVRYSIGGTDFSRQPRQ